MVQMNLLAGQMWMWRTGMWTQQGRGVGVNWGIRIGVHMLHCCCYLAAKLCLTLWPRVL